MIRNLLLVLMTGMILSVFLIFLGYVKEGAFILILTPLFRNILYGFYSLYEEAYLFALFAFFTVFIILLT